MGGREVMGSWHSVSMRMDVRDKCVRAWIVSEVST